MSWLVTRVVNSDVDLLEKAQEQPARLDVQGLEGTGIYMLNTSLGALFVLACLSDGVWRENPPI